MSPGHSQRARAALARLPEVDPAIAALALWCTHRDDAGATRTDSETIYYGPGFDTMPIQEQVGLAAHHVLHVALKHSDRMCEMALRLGDGFDADLYALASDAIVNEVLLQGGHAVPRPAVRACDLIARALGEDISPERALADWDTDRLFLALVSGETQAAQSQRGAAERYAREQNFEPDLERGRESDEEAPETWATRLEQAMDAGRSAGIGIGQVLARFADLPQVQVPWERHLRRLLTKAVSEVPRLSTKRPAGRWVAREAEARRTGRPAPVFEPGQSRDRRRARIVVGIDTSSSITDVHLDLFAAETLSISRRTGAEVRVLGFDTAVHTDVHLRQAHDLAEVEFARGGGTAFDPVIEAAARYDPSALAVLTDLDGPMSFRPGFPMIWAVPAVPTDPPAFGTVLLMNR